MGQRRQVDQGKEGKKQRTQSGFRAFIDYVGSMTFPYLEAGSWDTSECEVTSEIP